MFFPFLPVPTNKFLQLVLTVEQILRALFYFDFFSLDYFCIYIYKGEQTNECVINILYWHAHGCNIKMWICFREHLHIITTRYQNLNSQKSRTHRRPISVGVWFLINVDNRKKTTIVFYHLSKLYLKVLILQEQQTVGRWEGHLDSQAPKHQKGYD